MFFIGLFGNNFFKIILDFVEHVAGDDKRKFVSDKRDMIIRTFKKQARFTPEKMIKQFSDGGSALKKSHLEKMFAKFAKSGENAAEIATHALEHWDKNGDGKLEASELEPATNYDGKLSLGVLSNTKSKHFFSLFFMLILKLVFCDLKKALDPSQGGILSKIWDVFLLVLIGYFFVSIIDHLAISEYRERLEASKKKDDKPASRRGSLDPTTPVRFFF